MSDMLYELYPSFNNNKALDIILAIYNKISISDSVYTFMVFSELADKVGGSKTTSYKALDLLEDDGIITTHNQKDFPFSKEISLTQEGLMIGFMFKKLQNYKQEKDNEGGK